VKELHALLKKVEAIHEKAKKKSSKTSLSEVIDRATTIAFGKQALKVSKQAQFDKLPMGEKFSKLKKELDGLNKSPYVKALLAEKKEQEEREAFERFYEEHANKHGRSL
jgi:predicted metal-dependent hydrolase